MAIRSCCCFSLKTGTTIIAVLSILGSISGIINISVRIPQYDKTNVFSLFFMSVRGFTIQKLIEAMISLALSVLLFIGVRKEQAHLIFPYLIYNLAYFFNSIAVYGGILSDAFVPDVMPTTIALAILIPFQIALAAYFILVIYTFHQKLISEQVGREVNLLGGKIFGDPSYNNV